MKREYSEIGKRNKPLTQGQKGENQIENSDGAYVFEVDEQMKLNRFLILGSEGGSYYANAQKLTLENAKTIQAMIEVNGVEVVKIVVDVSESGRSPKNDPALLVLAMCAASKQPEVRRAALDALHRVARIGTHLFNFMDFHKQFAGTGRMFKTAVANWYNQKTVNDVSFQVGKYQQRNGWSHRDVMRISHPNPKIASDSEKRNIVYKWVTKPEEVSQEELKSASEFLAAFEEIKKTDNQKTILSLVEKYKMPLELVPTEKRTKKIYERMLDNFGLTALIRNLGVLTAQEVLKQGSFDNINKVCERLKDVKQLKKARIHPLSVLVANEIYAQGHGMRGKLSWNPVPKILDALGEAFYMSFDYVEPTNKRLMLSLDVSGSMTFHNIANMPITPRNASAALAMVTMRTEENYIINGFSSNLMDLNISPKQTLEQVVKSISNLNFDYTDCSLPMRRAQEKNLKIDAFVIYTDSETNAYGQADPMTALKRYRNQTGIDAKLIVVGMVSNGFSVADPNDTNCLDVVGFSTDTPAVISNFIKGEC